MLTRIKLTFLILVLTQGLHSVEEYMGRLWDVYAPAKFICSLISTDGRKGFLILDIALLIFGLCCWLFTIRRNHLYAQGPLWFWIIMEIINVLGHVSWALSEGKYVPGVASAPILFILALYLAKQLLNFNSADQNKHR